MPVKRSIAALAIALGISGCGATVQPQAPIPARPILQAGDSKMADMKAGDTEAMKKAHRMMRIKKLTRFFNALAAKDPAIKADLDQLKTRILALTEEQRRALHAMIWDENKNSTLEQMQQKLQGFLDAPATFVTHTKDHLDKLQAMSAADVAALAEKFPPATFKQLRKMMREAKKAEQAQAGKEAGMPEKAIAEEDEADEAGQTPAATARIQYSWW